MIFGYVTSLGRRAVVVLLALAGLLIWAGRSDASGLGELRPAAASFERVQPLHRGAELSLTGEIAVLHLPGGDVSALAARLAGGERAEVVVRIGGEEILVAELREVSVEDPSLEVIAERLLDDPHGIRIGSNDASALTHALHANGIAEDEAPEPRAARLASLDLPDAVRQSAAAVAAIPEPSTLLLLGIGLFGLVLASPRAGS